jgi:hypothetical protein
MAIDCPMHILPSMHRMHMRCFARVSTVVYAIIMT